MDSATWCKVFNALEAARKDVRCCQKQFMELTDDPSFQMGLALRPELHHADDRSYQRPSAAKETRKATAL
jgi:hypothetical protein